VSLTASFFSGTIMDLDLESKQTVEGSTKIRETTPTQDWTIRTKDFGFIPIPRRRRYDPNVPFQFTMLLNIIFGFASTTSMSILFPLMNPFGASCLLNRHLLVAAANLYYCQPLLGDL
jgi:hypothetical protein